MSVFLASEVTQEMFLKTDLAPVFAQEGTDEMVMG